MRGSNEKITRSSSDVTRHDRRGSCVVMTAGGPASSPTAATVRCDRHRDGFDHCDFDVAPDIMFVMLYSCTSPLYAALYLVYLDVVVLLFITLE